MALTILDAGVVIAILDASDLHHAAAREAVTRARMLVGPYRQSASTAAKVDDFLAALPARVEPATREVARTAARLRAQHGTKLRLPDALVVATAVELRAGLLLTTDAGWPSLPIPVTVVAGSGKEPGT